MHSVVKYACAFLANNFMFGIAMTPPFKSYPLYLRILLIFSMFFFNSGVISSVAALTAKSIFGIEDIWGVVAGNFSAPNSLNAFLFVQGISSLGMFMLTAMMFSVLESGEFKNHLRLTVAPSFKFLTIAVVAILVAQFFIDSLVKVTQMLPTTPELNEMERQMEKLTDAMMNFTGIGHLIAVSLVVAVVPAIGEEFFFRGLILGDLLKAKVRPAVAIASTGLLFALVHGQYHNILAIWVLGSFLGYLYYVSGSLWLPIAAHFTNNFLSVLLKYLYNTGKISDELANAEAPLYLTLIAVVVFAGLVFILHKIKRPADFIEPEPPTQNIA